MIILTILVGQSINYNYSNVGLNGGSRSIQMGLISQRGAHRCCCVICAECCSGIPLILKAGMPVLWLGLIGFFSGFFYTAPPFRFSSRKGLGELLIGLNFGPLMVAGSTLVKQANLFQKLF
ncbi:hypothetical protein Ct9H90mP29_03070 [bacterium]|nr:MAG: hypothetical protein Ct9H90mP29_03070 [bacterium]